MVGVEVGMEMEMGREEWGGDEEFRGERRGEVWCGFDCDCDCGVDVIIVCMKEVHICVIDISYLGIHSNLIYIHTVEEF